MARISKVAEPITNTQALRRHPRWYQIKVDLILATMSLEEVCEKYELRNTQGGQPVMILAKAIRQLREHNKNLFAVMEQQENAFLRREYLLIIREGVNMSKETRRRALDAGEYTTALLAEEQIIKTASKIGEVIDATNQRAPAPTQGFTQNNTYNLLALPKLPGVPTRAPQLIESTKEIPN